MPPDPIDVASPVSLVGAWLLVVGAIALAVGGFVNSYAAVRDAFDVGVAVFSGIELLLTHLGRRLWWLHLVSWALVAATVVVPIVVALAALLGKRAARRT